MVQRYGTNSYRASISETIFQKNQILTFDMKKQFQKRTFLKQKPDSALLQNRANIKIITSKKVTTYPYYSEVTN
jgi:hypothetical protein